METILENIIELAEEIWLKLDTLLDLENMEALASLEPLLSDILSDPLKLGVTAAIIAIVPFGIYKIKKAHAEKEKRLDELLHELDETEEIDENDKSRLRKKIPEPSGYDEPDINILNKLEEKDLDDDDDYERYKEEYERSQDPDDAEDDEDEAYGDEFESPTSQEEISAAKDTEDLDKTLREIMGDEFSWENESPTVSSELAENLIDEGATKDQAILDLQTEMEESIQALTESLSQKIDPPLPTESQTKIEDIEDTEVDGDTEIEHEIESEAVSELDEESSVESVSKTDQELLQEMEEEPDQEEEEETVLDLEQMLEAENEKEEEGIEFHFEEAEEEPEQEETPSPSAEVADTTPPVTAPPTVASFYEEPHDDIEGAEILEQNSSEDKEDSNLAFIEASSEIFQEVPQSKPVRADETEPPQPALEVTTPPVIPEPPEVSLEETEIEPELEPGLEPEPVLAITPEPSQAQPVVARSSAGPLLKSMLNSSVSAKTDALVSRLKTFQAKLETRFHSLEPEPETEKKGLMSGPLRKKRSPYQQAGVSYRSKRKSRSNKEYLNLLESFIFMAKHKNK